jgi:hypothetical protein
VIRPEIEDLVGVYCDAVLRFDPDRFASTWADGATWAIPGTGVVTGRPAIVETFVEIRATYRRCIQEILNGVVEAPEADGATARWQVRELQWRSDGTGSELIGVYHDTLSRTPEGWKFARRDFELIYDGPVAMPGRLRDSSSQSTSWT